MYGGDLVVKEGHAHQCEVYALGSESLGEKSVGLELVSPWLCLKFAG